MVLLNLLLAFGETSGCLFTKVLGSLPAPLQTPFNQKFARTLVRKGGLEPPWVTPPDPKSGASANSATFAGRIAKIMTNATGTDYSSILGIHCPIVKLPADRP